MTDTPKADLRRYALYALLAAFLLELAAFTALQYRTPAALMSIWYMNRKGPNQFAAALFGRAFAPMSDSQFRPAFSMLLAALYVTYGAAIFWLRRRPAMSAVKAMAIVAAAGAIAAVFFPPSLSTDIYSYVAYAQMPARHINPYFHSPQALIDAGAPIAFYLPRSGLDPTHHRINWDLPSVYGPVWTVISIAAVRIGGAWSLWATVLALKLIELGALLVAAAAAGRIAARHNPGGAAGAVLIVGLNPLALIEGAGSGHNDLLMMACALLAAAWLQERRPVLGGLALGVSIGVKFVTLGLLPWLLIDLWRASPKAQRLRAAAAATAAAAAPIVICYAPFWHGLATLNGLTNRKSVIQTASGAGVAAAHHPLPSTLIAALHEHGAILALYAALTLLLLFHRKRGGWVHAWTIFSGAFIYYSMGIWFPWYMLWPWMALLAFGLRTDAGDFLCFAIGVLALTLSIFYTTSSGQYAARLLETAIWLCLWVGAGAAYVRWKRSKKFINYTS